MKFGFFTKRTFVFVVVLIVFVLNINAQNTFTYISPQPGSKYIMPENNIAFRIGEELNAESVKGFSINVTGTESRKISGKLILSDDSKTLIFLPVKPFAFGERISVSTSGYVKTKSGQSVSGESFWFEVTKTLPLLPANYFIDKEMGSLAPFNNSEYSPKNTSGKNNNLPDDFPEISIEVSNAPANNGYYFACPFGYWGWFPDNVPYLMIFDDFGTPVYYKKLYGHAYDFKKHTNGKISHYYNLWPDPFIVVMDSSYNQIDAYDMQNGYGADFHEFHMLDNGHAIMQGYDAQIVDMSQVVPGGDPEAVVIGWIIQEVDAYKNVVFQWRSWDHFEIIDALGYEDLTAATIDPFHGNAIEPYTDDYLLLSTRNINEITKISRNTGEIIWRMEGNNNMFEFNNDTLGFSRQHDCRILDNGNLTLFDNGNEHTNPPFSSMVEYELDEVNYKVNLVRRYRSSPDNYGSIMGNTQKTQDNRYVVGQGSGVPGITEFTELGEIAMEIYFAGINYRAFRHNWSTNRFYPENDTMHFGYLWMEETRTLNTNVFNDQDEDIILTSFHSRTENYVVENDFPLTIPAGGNELIQITILPEGAGKFEDVITLNSDINSPDLVQRIAQQIVVIGHATEDQSVNENNQALIHVYPNPLMDFLYIEALDANRILDIQLLDIFGKKIMEFDIDKTQHGKFDISHVATGLYFLQTIDAETNNSTFVKIIKH